MYNCSYQWLQESKFDFTIIHYLVLIRFKESDDCSLLMCDTTYIRFAVAETGSMCVQEDLSDSIIVLCIYSGSLMQSLGYV